MFIGHYGVAFGLKGAVRLRSPSSTDKTISLGLLFLAVQFVDILWTVLVLLRIEKVEISPGLTAANPLDFTYYPFTHSLLMSFVWAGLVYVLFRFVPVEAGWQKGKAALLLAIAVLSHFFLDLLVHRPDLPIGFGAGSPKIGLGLWNHPAAAYLLEGIIFAGGLGIYLKTTRGTGFAGKYGILILALFLLAANFINLFGPPPPSGTAVAASGLAFNLLIAWLVFWLDKKRA